MVRPHPYCILLVFMFHVCLIIHLSWRLSHLNQDTFVRMCFSFPIDPSPARTLKRSFFALSCSSKGPVFRCLEHMFLFGITTIIFILSTTVIVLGPAVIFQAIAITNKYIDPSFDGVWSQFKFGVVFLIILVITRLNARFPPSLVPLSGPLLWNNEKLGLI